MRLWGPDPTRMAGSRSSATEFLDVVWRGGCMGAVEAVLARGRKGILVKIASRNPSKPWIRHVCPMFLKTCPKNDAQ